jgi:hypothetical protein
MAATIAECTGQDSTRVKTAHKLGSRSATGRAATYTTFAECHVNADGSGYIQVERTMPVYGVQRIHIPFGPESSTLLESLTEAYIVQSGGQGFHISPSLASWAPPEKKES